MASTLRIAEFRCTFRQGIAHTQHRHQVVDVTVDTLSHTGVLGTNKQTETIQLNHTFNSNLSSFDVINWSVSFS